MKLVRQFVKYGGVAAGSAGSDWLIFAGLSLLDVHYIYAQMVARLVGGLFSFTINKYWAFDRGHGKLVVEGRRFLLLYVVSYHLSLAILYLLADKLGVMLPLAKLGADSTCLVINFIIMRVYVFHGRTGFRRLLQRGLAGKS